MNIIVLVSMVLPALVTAEFTIRNLELTNTFLDVENQPLSEGDPLITQRDTVPLKFYEDERGRLCIGDYCIKDNGQFLVLGRRDEANWSFKPGTALLTNGEGSRIASWDLAGGDAKGKQGSYMYLVDPSNFNEMGAQWKKADK